MREVISINGKETTIDALHTAHLPASTIFTPAQNTDLYDSQSARLVARLPILAGR
jgi:hypothetical protein